MPTADNVYKVIEITGTSADSQERAIQSAIEKAGESLRHLRWFQVVETRGAIDDGKVSQYQVTLKLGFTLEDQRA